MATWRAETTGDPTKRGTGRTFRRMIQALLYASEHPDDRVFFICHNADWAQELNRRCKFVWDDHTVRFVSQHHCLVKSDFRVIPDAKVFWDHYMGE